MKPVLTIAGSDCSGGAGIQADLKTFSAHALFGMSVIVSVVAENTQRVISVQNIDEQIITDQMDAIFEDIFPEAVKIGMLPNTNIMRVVAKNLVKFKAKNIVIDPVMYAKNGFALMDARECDAFISTVLPLADVLTPNIPEAEHLCGFMIKNDDDMKKAAQHITNLGAKAVLIKGGHKKGSSDFLFYKDEFFEYKTTFIDTKNTHGTGCTLSSAIASNLALGLNLNDAIARAKAYITTAIAHSLELGKGCGPTNHFYELYKKSGLS